MSTTSDPPGADAERRGPMSIMPATENIDDDWGAEPEAGTATAEAPSEPAAVEARPVLKVEVPAPAKVPVISLPSTASEREGNGSASSAPSASPAPKAEPKPAATPRADATPATPAPKRSGSGGYVAAVALLAAAGIWWAVRSPEPETPTAPIAVAPTPVASAAPAPSPTEPPPAQSAAQPAAAESAGASASAAASAAAAPGASAASPSASASSAPSAAPAAAASAETGEVDHGSRSTSHQKARSSRSKAKRSAKLR